MSELDIPTGIGDCHNHCQCWETTGYCCECGIGPETEQPVSLSEFFKAQEDIPSDQSFGWQDSWDE